MIKTTYELNNQQKDSTIFDNKFNKYSPVVEIFSAMINGEELSKFGKKADKAVEYIKGLGSRAEAGDFSAIAELNTLRRYIIETPILQEIKLLGIFGSFEQVGFDETIEREVYNHVGERSRVQANNGDVVFPAITKERYTVGTHTVSGGYAVDYRRVANGDMTKENEGIAMVKTDIRNKALLLVITTVYNAIKNATGVKYTYEFAGLTKTGVDDVIRKVRRNGKPTVVGDYSVISQFNGWAGYDGTVNSHTITGISEKSMNEIASTGLLATYNGTVLAEIPNPYNEYELNATGDNFKTLLPEGLAFVIPAGTQSPIKTWTRGGLTSFTGNNVVNGKIESRFDLEVAVDVAKGQEHKIGTLYDTQIGGL
jgi:hypothetical protein